MVITTFKENEKIKEIILQKKSDIGQDLVFGNNCIIERDLYGESIQLGIGCLVKGNIYARRRIILADDVEIIGDVISLESIEVGRIKSKSLIAPKIKINSKIILSDSIACNNDIIIYDESIIKGSITANTIILMNRVQIGDKKKTRIVTSSITIGNNCKIIGLITSNTLKMNKSNKIEYLDIKGNTIIQEGFMGEGIKINGDCKIMNNCSIKELKILGKGIINDNFESSHNVIIKSHASFGTNINLRHLIVEGKTIFKDNFRAEAIEIGNKSDEYSTIPNKSRIGFLKGHKINIGNACEIKKIEVSSIKLGDECIIEEFIQAKENLLIGDKCTLGSIVAGNNINIGKQCVINDNFSILSYYGSISVKDKIKMKGTIIGKEHIFDFGKGQIMTLISRKDLYQIIDWIISQNSLVDTDLINKMIKELNFDRKIKAVVQRWSTQNILKSLGLKSKIKSNSADTDTMEKMNLIFDENYDKYINTLQKQIIKGGHK